MGRGTPQIEVTFDVDANAILNVSAIEKAGGRSKKITITNDKGRLSKEEIDAKNGLEYSFNIKSTLEDSNIKDKIPESERKMMTNKCNDAIEWLEKNQMAEVDEFKDKQKELENT